jgi:hypothetical protein
LRLWTAGIAERAGAASLELVGLIRPGRPSKCHVEALLPEIAKAPVAKGGT